MNVRGGDEPVRAAAGLEGSGVSAGGVAGGSAAGGDRGGRGTRSGAPGGAGERPEGRAAGLDSRGRTPSGRRPTSTGPYDEPAGVGAGDRTADGGTAEGSTVGAVGTVGARGDRRPGRAVAELSADTGAPVADGSAGGSASGSTGGQEPAVPRDGSGSSPTLADPARESGGRAEPTGGTRAAAGPARSAGPTCVAGPAPTVGPTRVAGPVRTAGPVRAARPARRVPVIRIKFRSGLVLALASLAGLAMFFWPLFGSAEPRTGGMAHTADAPLVFVVAMPVLLAVVLAEMASGGIDTKALAMLGVLSAVNAGLRPLGAGTAGIETVFFLLVLAGRVFGPGFGFVLGATSLFASALLTAGVGPWLPFQMIASAWIGLGAGLLPRRVTGRAEIAMLVGYGIVVAYGFGFLMNMWFWPFTAGPDTQLSFQPGAPLLDNLHRFAAFTLVTSTFGWDTGRAVTNTVAILLTGPAVLTVLRRAARRAAFDAPVTFTPASRR